MLDEFDVPGPKIEIEGEVEGEGGSKWGRFRKAIARLNDQAPENTFYKVLYLARHGQGTHVCSSFPFLSFLIIARDWRLADVFLVECCWYVSFLFDGYVTNW